MNNEIKEMLYKLDSISNGAYNNDGYVDLKQNEAHLLLDYITNLQQENERLKEANKYLDELRNANYLSWQDSLSRIEKAVEYMRKHIEKCNIDGYEGKFDNFDIFTKPQELLNILEGKSDE